MAKQSKYASYDEVPTFRKQWFFWLAYLFFTPAAIFILLFGDIYYVKNNQVESFGIAKPNRCWNISTPAMQYIPWHF